MLAAWAQITTVKHGVIYYRVSGFYSMLMLYGILLADFTFYYTKCVVINWRSSCQYYTTRSTATFCSKHHGIYTIKATKLLLSLVLGYEPYTKLKLLNIFH